MLFQCVGTLNNYLGYVKTATMVVGASVQVYSSLNDLRLYFDLLHIALRCSMIQCLRKLVQQLRNPISLGDVIPCGFKGADHINVHALCGSC